MSDLDGVLERKGYFIVFEVKNEGEEMSMGQKILLDHLAGNRRFTVYLVHGTASFPLGITKYPDGKRIKCDKYYIARLLNEWWQWAERKAADDLLRIREAV